MEKCPVSITIPAIGDAMKIKDEDKKAAALIATGVRQCVDCGCCSYVCPAHRPVLATNQDAKWWLKQYERAKQQKVGGSK
jgi:electron transport complex protein RnfC